MGAAAVWREGAHTSPPWVAQSGFYFRPVPKPADWTEQRNRLGNNKEVFGAELYALHQTFLTLERRNEGGFSAHWARVEDVVVAVEVAVPMTKGGRRYNSKYLCMCQYIDTIPSIVLFVVNPPTPSHPSTLGHPKSCPSVPQPLGATPTPRPPPRRA